MNKNKLKTPPDSNASRKDKAAQMEKIDSDMHLSESMRPVGPGNKKYLKRLMNRVIKRGTES